MNEFVYLKLINGEQLMALRETEDTDTVTVKFPMLIKTHLVSVGNGKVSEQVTAGPYSLFGDVEQVRINKHHIVLDTTLAERAIPHYVRLVQEHEGVNIKYTPKALVWEDEIPEGVPEEVDVAKVLDALKAIANEEEYDEQEVPVFIEGNKTVH